MLECERSKLKYQLLHWNIMLTLTSQTFVQAGWTLAGIAMLFTVYILEYMRSGFWVSILFPSVGRTVWCIPVGFIILASSSTQHGEGEEIRYVLVGATL